MFLVFVILNKLRFRHHLNLYLFIARALKPIFENSNSFFEDRRSILASLVFFTFSNKFFLLLNDPIQNCKRFSMLFLKVFSIFEGKSKFHRLLRLSMFALALLNSFQWNWLIALILLFTKTCLTAFHNWLLINLKLKNDL